MTDTLARLLTLGQHDEAADLLDADLAAKQPLDADLTALASAGNSTVLASTTAAFTTADETKLDGIATGATANSSDATLLDRANHTGTQAIATVTGLQTALDGLQPLDSDLTAVAGLSPSNDDFMQRKAGAWANRTVAQVKTDLGLTGTNSGDQTITLTGDVTGSGTGSFATTIPNDTVTYAKVQNVSATDRILGRSTAGAGDIEEITCTATGRSILDDTSVGAVRTTLGVGTADSPEFAAINLGAATDTTIARVSAGVISVEGVTIPTISSTSTLSNKRITPRVTTITSSATPTVNTDTTDFVDITALAAAITSMTTNLSGTPTNGDKLVFRIKDNGTARAITWGASFEPIGVALPTTTTISKRTTVGFIWDSTTSKWGCVAAVTEA